MYSLQGMALYWWKSAHFCCFSSRAQLGTLVGTEIPQGRGLWKMNWMALVFSRDSRADSVLIRTGDLEVRSAGPRRRGLYVMPFVPLFAQRTRPSLKRQEPNSRSSQEIQGFRLRPKTLWGPLLASWVEMALGGLCWPHRWSWPLGASAGLIGGVGPLGPPWPLPLGQSSGHPYACLGYPPLGVGPFNVPTLQVWPCGFPGSLKLPPAFGSFTADKSWRPLWSILGGLGLWAVSSLPWA